MHLMHHVSIKCQVLCLYSRVDSTADLKNINFIVRVKCLMSNQYLPTLSFCRPGMQLIALFSSESCEVSKTRCWYY